MSEHEHDEDAVVERMGKAAYVMDVVRTYAQGDNPRTWEQLSEDERRDWRYFAENWMRSHKPGDRLPGVDEIGNPVTLVVVPEKSTTHMQCAALEAFVEVVSEKYDYLDAELGEDGKERRRQWRLGSLQRDGREMDAVYRAMLASSDQ